MVPNAARPAKAKGPTFSIAIVLPDRARAQSSHTIYSLKAITFVTSTRSRRPTRYVDVVNSASGCTLTYYAGAIGGCEVQSDGSQSYTIKRSTFAFYSKPHAKGCVLAEGTYKGTLGLGTVPITFKQKNAKTCW